MYKRNDDWIGGTKWTIIMVLLEKGGEWKGRYFRRAQLAEESSLAAERTTCFQPCKLLGAKTQRNTSTEE